MRLFRAAVFALAASWVLVSFVLAAPFERTTKFKQPDGTVITLHGKGDEFYAVFETLDGYSVVYDADTRAYYYARLSDDRQRLVSSGLMVGGGNPATLGIPKHLRMSRDAIRAQVARRRQRWELGMQVEERWSQLKASLQEADEEIDGTGVSAPPSQTTTGAMTGLCLLVDFSDEPASVSQSEVDNFCNGDAYTGYGNNGSVKQYFQDVSDGTLTYTNVVTVWIRAPQPKGYYDDPTQGCGSQGNLLVRDAIQAMKALPNYESEIWPTLADLTLDGSGNAIATNVFYAGTVSSPWRYGLWPHSWALYEVGAQELRPNAGYPSKKVFRYQITDIGSSLELGTFCHENGHMLCGFPDIYDYDDDSRGGAGMFCLMNSGGHGTNPVQVCAYLKRAAGWTTTLNLTSASALTAIAQSSGAGFNEFYKYTKPGISTEYFLIENRQSSGRDANLPASGVAIWHIDELGDRDNQSLLPNSTHQNYEVTLVQADNLWHFQNDVNSGDAYDLYYLGNAAAGYLNALSDWNAPHANWWDGTDSGLLLHHFSAAGASMTFEIGVQPAVVDAEPPTTPGVTNTIAWTPGPHTNEHYVEYDTLSDFTSPDGNSGWIAGTTHEFCDLTPGQTYYYRTKSRMALPVAIQSWNQTSQADFFLDTLTNVTATADGSVILNTTGGGEAVDTLGSTTYPWSGGVRTRFNLIQCTTSTTLTQIEMYFNISSSTQIEYAVWESPTQTGIYDRIAVVNVPASGTGQKFYSSGALSVPLVAGRYYFIGAAWNGTLGYYGGTTGEPSFGTFIGGFGSSHYPTLTAYSGSGITPNTTRYYERLTTAGQNYSTEPGTVLTPEINPSSFTAWGALTFNRIAPTGATLTVDVLDGTGTPLVTNVASGTDLNGIGITQRPLRLRANLQTTDTSVTPSLQDWSLNWAEPDRLVESGWSNVVFSTQVSTLGISVSPATFNFGIVDPGHTADNAASPLVVENTGNVAEDVGIRIKDEDNLNEWSAGTPTENVYELSTRLAAEVGIFGTGDVLTTDVQWCDGAVFGGGGSGMAPDTAVNQWFQFKAPTAVTGEHAEEEHVVTVEISCQQSP